MINILLLIIETIICYVAIVVLHKKYKKNGIYYYSIAAIVVSHILILKNISILGINISMGLGCLASLLICSNILTQNYGKESLKEYLICTVVAFISTYCFIYLLISIDGNNEMSYIFNNIFEDSTSSYIALFISTIIGIILSNKIYYNLKKKKNKIVISNIIAILSVELIENIIFVLFASYSDLSSIDLIMCIIIRDITKTIIGLIGTIPLYLITKSINWEEKNENS